MPTDINLGVIKAVYKGVHDQALVYKYLNIVETATSVYQAKTAVPADTLISNEAYWMELSGSVDTKFHTLANPREELLVVPISTNTDIILSDVQAPLGSIVVLSLKDTNADINTLTWHETKIREYKEDDTLGEILISVFAYAKTEILHQLFIPILGAHSKKINIETTLGIPGSNYDENMSMNLSYEKTIIVGGN